jgi:xanthine dehydrogenase YagS FAD-binding subunit
MMKKFEHVNPGTIEEAVSALREVGPGARVVAGGTDLIGGLKDDIWPERPSLLINLKTVPGLNHIVQDERGVRVGALVTLSQVAESPIIQQGYPALAEAARRTASPLIRNLGTLGGNLCQENRCWYYRYPSKLGGRIDCVRKGDGRCLAAGGDHRYHSIFGAVKKCLAVNPSDTAPAVIALGAQVVTSARTLPAEELFSAENGMGSTVLSRDEIIREIRLPGIRSGSASSFIKLAFRKTIDFALVNGAAFLDLEENEVVQARICLNGVHNVPYRPAESEAFLIGKPLVESTIQEAAELALSKARPLPMNRYKVQMARSVVADVLRACKRPEATVRAAGSLPGEATADISKQN